MTWQIALLLAFAGLFAAGLVMATSSMLALKIGDVVIGAYRRLLR